jgi:hypothetical protein
MNRREQEAPALEGGERRSPALKGEEKVQEWDATIPNKEQMPITKEKY